MSSSKHAGAGANKRNLFLSCNGEFECTKILAASGGIAASSEIAASRWHGKEGTSYQKSK